MGQFLPVTIEEMRERGWEQADWVYVIGDAYVDHSSFGPAVISRVLESRSYKVAIISQPDWKDPASVTVFGEPRLGFLVSAGNMDSMVSNYTVNKHHRRTDAYTPGGKTGARPDYAVSVYCNLIKRNYKKTPVIIGGIEASLRRLAHYDYWSDRLKRSILLDSGADLLLYGMGERAIVEVADALAGGMAIQDVTYVRGTCYKTRDVEHVYEGIRLPDYDDMMADKRRYAESFAVQCKNTDSVTAHPLIESYGEHRFVVQNPPQPPLSMQELDDVYELPYENTYHPSYEEAGGVPAISEIKFSLTSCRGCFGGCSFCALAFHQGRVVQARSHTSLVKEAEQMTRDPQFKGYLHDVGGPTANFRGPACKKQLKHGVCSDRQCLFPEPCPNLITDHSDYISLLRKLRKVPGVKKVFIRSGVRFDYVLADPEGGKFLKELCANHISGQLRLAPEHVSDRVLKLMGKPGAEVYRGFCRKFDEMNKKLKIEQYQLPYLISSHPGSELSDAIALAEAVRDMGYMPEQVQDFYPTPSTISTCMYYTGVDPRTMEEVYVPRTAHEKAMQRALIQYRDPKNYKLVKEALMSAGREDLIGFDRRKHLIPPRPIGEKNRGAGGESSAKARNAGARGVKSTDAQGAKNAGVRGEGKGASGRVSKKENDKGRRGSGRK